MHLKNVFIRFYKSFNFDYLRKFNPNVRDRFPWEDLDSMWYPYVRVPIDPKITTVVGENESGKTQLLTAIEKGICGKGIEREDFCRYSQFFAVEQGKMKWPDFGFEWAGLSPDEKKQLVSAAAIEQPGAFDHFYLFRTNQDTLTIYLPRSTGGFSTHNVPSSSVNTIVDILPKVFHMKAKIALPESVPIRWLADGSSAQGLEGLARQKRVGLFDILFENIEWFLNKESVTKSAGEIATTMSSFTGKSSEDDRTKKQEAELTLARDLILKVAKIDSEAIKELLEALKNGRDAFANSIIDKINEALDASLNFPHWWVQDSAFKLQVSAREYDLVFTIRDRTGKDYSFGERSSGLKYFLSYYVQYLAHEQQGSNSEILIMDEPDAFLSSQGQQDLLKIFDAFANPESGKLPIQVIYVTHSPFLIDKNHSERIRVLEKGVGDEGTRVVRDVSRNHYEPLRSAFGSFVGETTFIGNCNLITEGPADQILLAGATTYLQSHGASHLETLDLNHLTIVPASGATNVPYLVYLARGRDIEKPAVVVLLDSDAAGDKAKKGILRGGPREKQLLNPSHIVQVRDIDADGGIQTATDKPAIEIEDLIPLPVCVEATRQYLLEVCGLDSEKVENVTEESIRSEIKDNIPVFKAIQSCLKNMAETLHIEKIGFARSVNAVIAQAASAQEPNPLKTSVTAYEQNMRALFRHLSQIQREALRELSQEQVSQRLERAKRSFLQDHPGTAKREHVFILFEEISAALDDSFESDKIKFAIQAIRRDFKIDEDLTLTVENYPIFKDRLQALKYAARLATQDPTDTPSSSSSHDHVKTEEVVSPHSKASTTSAED